MTALEHDDTYVQNGHVAVEVDLDSAAWWAAVRAGEFLLPVCADCRGRWFPATPRCPNCASAKVGLAPASPRGRISTWIVVHYALDAAFVDDTPYTIVCVELDDGGRMFGRLLSGTPLADVAAEARTYDVGPDRLVGFIVV